MAYRILSFDGGGMRGFLTLLLLERLTAVRPELLERADLLAGTSSGGLIALCLAAGRSPREVREMFEVDVPTIFADSLLDDVVDLGKVLGAEYSSSGLEEVARRELGGSTLAELGKHVLVPAFDLDNGDDPRYGGTGSARRRWKAKIFHNFSGSDGDGAVPAWRVALYTAAAPVYFPSFGGYIDGGVVAANPALCALAQTQDTRSFPRPPRLETVSLLSLGTGQVAQFIAGESHDWGALQWGRPLVDIFMTGTVQVTSYQCRSFLGERYLRLSPDLERSDRLHLDSFSPQALGRMREIASAVDLQEATEWLARHW